MSIIIDGNKIAQDIRQAVREEASDLARRTGIVPGLAVVLAGDDPASKVYVGRKAKACAEVGFLLREYKLPADVGEADLLLDSGVVDGKVVPEKMREVRALLAKAQNDADAALRALRHTVAGIHPKVLSDLGLEAAVRNLAAESPLEVTVRVPNPLPPIPEGVIAAGYFLVAEALTNAAKYAPGSCR